MGKEEWLEEICKKYGYSLWLGEICEKYSNFKWPPYPKELVFPVWIMKEGWEYRTFSSKRRGKSFPLLHMEEYLEKIAVGDKFNCVVMPKKRKKGFRALERHHRIFQLFPRIKKIGHIVYRDSISGAKTIRKGEVMKGRVHRVEVVSINYKKRTFDCVALANTFNKDNLLENLIYYNYENYQK